MLDKAEAPYEKLSAGIDVGSTTVKMVVLNEKSRPSLPSMNATIRISKLPQKVLLEAQEVIGNQQVALAITGSGGMGLAEVLAIPFVQEVIACTKTVETLIPETNVAIELGEKMPKSPF